MKVIITESQLYRIIESRKKKGVEYGIPMPPELKKKINDKGLPSGFSVGKDKNGYFIYTHRARSKSHECPCNITVKEIKFIDSTG